MKIGEIILDSTNSAFKTRKGAMIRMAQLEKEGIFTEPRHYGDKVSDAHVLVVVGKPEERLPEAESLPDVTPLSELEEDKQSEEEERRPPRIKRDRNRTPLGTQGPLYIAERYRDPNYVERIVNEKPGRIDMFMNAGYEMVCVSEGRVVGDPHCGKGTKVGTPVRIHTGGDEYGYLMRIKKEWYEEDQEAKKKKRMDIEQDLTQQTKEEGRYGEIKFNA